MLLALFSHNIFKWRRKEKHLPPFHNTLRKKCPYSELFWSTFSRIRTQYRQIKLSIYSVYTEYLSAFSPNAENTDQNNSKYGHFSHSYKHDNHWKTDRYVTQLTGAAVHVFLGKGVLKIYSRFAGEHPCLSVISLKLICIALLLYLHHTSTWVFSCKFAAYFQNTFS